MTNDFFRSLKIRKKTSGGITGDMRIGDILCENVRIFIFIQILRFDLTYK